MIRIRMLFWGYSSWVGCAIAACLCAACGDDVQAVADSGMATSDGAPRADAAAGADAARPREASVVWATAAGGTGRDYPTSVSVLADGSSIVGGSFSDTATFGADEANETLLSSAGGLDFFTARYEADGALAWAKRAGTTGADQRLAVSAFGDGTFVTCGNFLDDLTLGPGEPGQTVLASTGSSDGFVARFFADGRFSSVAQITGDSLASCRSVSTIADGSFLAAGHVGVGTTVFGSGEPSETSFTGSGAFVARYGADDKLVWAKLVPGAETHSIAASADGASFVTGLMIASATFGMGESGATTLTPSVLADAFVARYNPDGTLAWARGASGGTNGVAVAADAAGATVIGTLLAPATFGGGGPTATTLTPAADTVDGFVVRYHTDGTLAWAQQIECDPVCQVFSAAVLADGSSVVTGGFGATAVFDPAGPDRITLATAGDRLAMFVAVYDNTGALSWAKKARGTDGSQGIAVAAGPGNSFVLAGEFAVTVALAPGAPEEFQLTSAGDSDAFIGSFAP